MSPYIGEVGGEPEDGTTLGRDLPRVALPGGAQTISSTAAALGKLIARENTHFVRGGAVVRVSRDGLGRPVLAPVRSAELASDFEGVALLEKVSDSKSGPTAKPTTCTDAMAKLILASRAFTDELPPLRLLSTCPVLVERDGALVGVVGYDRETGILAEGPAPEVVSLEEATEILDGLVAGFRFATPSDRSRALAALITPALVFGGLLPGRAPVDLGEADQSQTGKGYRNKLAAAIYGDTPTVICQQRGGVGSLEEGFDQALIRGKTLLGVDNVRGRVDSQKLESFLTEDTYNARAAYLPNTEIDPRRIIVMFTSNKADMTVDLANRSSCVRLLKQPPGHHYRAYPEGDLLAHIRANQPRYLGAVFAVVRAWYAAGKPRTRETRHDFGAWAQILDWIVQHLLGAAPLLDGHCETQQRMTNPALNWLRDVALAVVRQGREDQWLLASDLLDVIDVDGSIEIPGLPDGADVEDEAAQDNALLQMGKRFKRCFGDSDHLTVDKLTVEREGYSDDKSRPRHRYRVTASGACDVWSDAAQPGALASGQNGVCTAQAVAPLDAPRDDPAMHPAINPENPAIPATLPILKEKKVQLNTPLGVLGSIAGPRGIEGDSGNADQGLIARLVANAPEGERETLEIV